MKYVKQFLLAVFMLTVGTAHAQTCVTTAGVTTCTYSIPDDGYAIVPIPFGFPFYGRIFTHSLFFDNGVVSFYSPTDPMRTGGQNYFAQPLDNNIGSNFYYSIMPMWSDLVNYSGSHTTETDGSGFLRYNWNNVSQWGIPDRLNTFSLEIRPTGYIGINYQKINIDGYPVTAGIVGDASLGEWHQHYHKPPQGPANLSSISNWSFNETYGADCSNPLNNANCPGYAEALFQQQCTVNPLYSPACPGYGQAYFTQQCTISALYDSACPGYAIAYYDQQCGLDPLYHTGCPGYDQAYFEQQCLADALYNNQCPGYAEAYALKFVVGSFSIAANVEESATVVAVVEEKTAATAETASPAATAKPAEPAAAVPLVTAAPAPVAAQSAAPAAPTRTEPAAAPAPKTTRQALAEQRMAAAREAAAKEAQDNPSAVAAEMDAADSMERQVEIQNVVLGAMGFVSGFDAYGRATIPDALGYRPFEIYPGQQNIDTPAARGLIGGSDRIHEEMVNEQYR
jgi:hypothetical protein